MGSAGLGKVLKGIDEVGASAFSNAFFHVGVTSFRQRHADQGFGVVLDDLEICRCVFAVATGVEDIR